MMQWCNHQSISSRVGSYERRTRNKEQGTGNKEQGTGNREAVCVGKMLERGDWRVEIDDSRAERFVWFSKPSLIFEAE